MHVCIYIYIYICIYVYIYTHIYMHIYIYIYIFTYLNIHIYTIIQIYIDALSHVKEVADQSYIFIITDIAGPYRRPFMTSLCCNFFK
jgi:hypothetical protein